MKKIILATPALLCIVLTSHAQNNKSQIVYHNGQSFEKTTYMETTSKITGPSSTVNMHSNIAVNSTYDVIDSSSAGYSFNFTIQKLTADLESGGQKMRYNSAGPADTSSLIQKAFDLVVDKKIKLIVNKKGVITGVSAADQQAMNNPVEQNVQANITKFTTGTIFDLNTSMPVSPASKPGDIWSDSSKTANKSQFITFKINSITNGLAAVTFAGVITSKNETGEKGSATKQESTMNISGELSMNINSGIVETRTANFITSGKIETGSGVLLTSVNSTSREVLIKR